MVEVKIDDLKVDGDKDIETGLNNTVDAGKASKAEHFLKKINKQEEDNSEEIKDKNIDKAIDSFNKQGSEVLKAIKENMIKIFTQIDWSNASDPKLSTFEDAYEAFSTDITALEKTEKWTISSEVKNLLSDISDIINFKKIEWDNAGTLSLQELKNLQTKLNTEEYKTLNSAPPNKLQTNLNNLITNLETKAKEAKEKDEVDLLLNMPATRENAITLFEKTSKETYNKVFDKVFGEWPTPVTLNADKWTQDQKLFIWLLKAYVGDKEISDIKIGKANTSFHPEYKTTGTNVVEFKITENDKKIDKVVIRWSQDEMQQERAKNNEITKINWAQQTLNEFDDKWNYQEFKQYLVDLKEDTQVVKENMKTICEQILTYKPTPWTSDAWETLNDLKNGYCKVFCDYIIAKKSDSSLVQSYLNQIKSNVALLGNDSETQLDTYNKLTTVWIDLKGYVDESVFKEIAQKWWALEAGKDKLKQGMKLFLDLLTSLGVISKATLKSRWLGKAFDGAINSYFQEKYEISDKQRKRIDGITWEKGWKFNKETYTNSLKTKVKVDPGLLDIKVMETLLSKAKKQKTDYITYTWDKAEIKKEKVDDLVDAIFGKEWNRNDDVWEELEKNTQSRHKSAESDITEEAKLNNGDKKAIKALSPEIQSKILTIYLTDLGIKKDMAFVVSENFSKEPNNQEQVTEKKYTTKEAVNFRDGKWNILGTEAIPQNSELTAILENGKEVTKKWSVIWLDKDNNLKDKDFIKVKFNNQEGFVAKEYITEKQS